MIDSFWPELERDFQLHLNGLNAMDWIAGKRDWRQFYRFKETLKQGTAYHSALVNDPEIAAEVAKVPRKAGASESPDAEGWTPLRNDLADVKDLLLSLAAVIISTNGGESSPSPVQRPVYEVERIRSAASKATVRKITAALVPHQFPNFEKECVDDHE